MCDIAEFNLSDLTLLNSNFLLIGVVFLKGEKVAHKTREAMIIYKSEEVSKSYEICKAPPNLIKTIIIAGEGKFLSVD